MASIPIHWIIIAALSAAFLLQRGCYNDIKNNRDAEISDIKATLNKQHTEQLAKIQEAQATALKGVQDAITKSGEKIEALRSTETIKTEKIERELQPIIQRHVYHNTCFDADGMRLANEASRASDAQPP